MPYRSITHQDTSLAMENLSSVLIFDRGLSQENVARFRDPATDLRFILGQNQIDESGFNSGVNEIPPMEEGRAYFGQRKGGGCLQGIHLVT